MAKEEDLSKSKVMYPHSKQARQDLARFLARQGVDIVSFVLYDTVPTTFCLPPLQLIEELLFTSPSTVSSFFDQIEHTPSTCVYRALGPVTLTTLEKRLSPFSRIKPIC
jgi:uroporphyrinogen-III synthase